MTKIRRTSEAGTAVVIPAAYSGLVAGIADLLDSARRVSARAVNTLMTATYWEIGRRIVEFEQGGKLRAEYGERVLERLAADLTNRFGRGFSLRNLRSFRMFYLGWPIRQTVSAESSQVKRSTPSGISPDASNLSKIRQALSAKSDVTISAARFPLPWSHYVRLLSVDNPLARSFYEAEALRGGWSVRQLDRQISTVLYLNYAREHWTRPDENPPVGLILCAQKGTSLARYALENLPNKVLAAEYKVTLPAEKTLAAEIERTRRLLEARTRR